MAINDSTMVVGVTPRISPAKFAAVLHASESPAASESNAEDAWAVVEQAGVDPAFALAVFHQESQFGADSASATARFNLRNPGHTRTSRTGVGQQVPTPPFGHFVQFPSWTEGWRDLAVRLVDPEFFYVRGLPDKPPGPGPHRSKRPILQIWAPADDQFDPFGFNNHERYVQNAIQNMINWVDLPDGGVPIDGMGACPPFPPPPFDGSDKQVGEVVFRTAEQTVEVGVAELNCRQFADPASCETHLPLRQGDSFEALYWVEGVEVEGERRWWVAKSGSRIWSGGTRQKPGER